jgi:Fe2+ or Zn2+ uptake regulation protein/O6-methylguanine-DNA--protein-cysteine methyltransferase
MATPSDTGELLRQSGLRVTPQRRAILSAFRGGSAEHLSADEVHSRASTAVPEIGRGTVYATLAELTELGLLGSVGNPEPVRYETNLNAHDHFRCRLCLRLFDVDLGGAELARRGLPGYAVERVAVIAEGVCHECQDYEQGLREAAETIAAEPLIVADAVADLSCVRIESPLGDLVLAASSTGIVRVAFPHHADFSTLAQRADRRRGPSAGHERLTALRGGLDDYFAGDHTPIPDAVDWRLSAPFAQAAIGATAAIPFGGSLSYEHIHDDSSPRDCGRAMGGNPVALLMPCHRVCRGSLRPEFYVGGADALSWLREHEAQ